MPTPILEPILDTDVPEFCVFLHRNLNPNIAADVWAEAFRQDWGVRRPNNGFLIRDQEGQIVGGIGAIYAERTIRGRPEQFCNITSWCVLEPYRSHSMRMALKLVSQPGYHFTDLSPTDVVAGVLSFLKFRPMDGRLTVMPNLPWWSPGTRMVTDPDAIEDVLEGPEALVVRDHRHFPWIRHAAVGRPGAYCYVVYKEGTLKRLPCAVVLYVSDPDLFLRYRGAFGRHFLLRHGMVSTRVETRLLPRRPWPSVQLDGYHKKLFRSDTLMESDIGNIYSEAVALDL